MRGGSVDHCNGFHPGESTLVHLYLDSDQIQTGRHQIAALGIATPGWPVGTGAGPGVQKRVDAAPCQVVNLYLQIDTIDTDLYLQNNSTNDVRVQNDLLVEGGIYNATVLDLADNSNILDVNLIRGYNDILFRGQQSSSSNDMKLTSGGDLEIYNDLTVSGSISGTLSSSCPGTPFAEDYVSGSNTRMCVYEMTTARNWPDSAARCYGNFNGAELCSYQQVRAMVSHGGMTFDGTERWLADVTLDDEALYTNRAVTSTGDGDIDNFEGDGDMDDTKRAFCCLRITN